jgi:drug/metabolite transporter (DMT)-like permease
MGQHLRVHEDAASCWIAITTIIFAWWLLNEQITPWFLLGTLLILVGMYLCDKKK